MLKNFFKTLKAWPYLRSSGITPEHAQTVPNNDVAAQQSLDEIESLIELRQDYRAWEMMEDHRRKYSVSANFLLHLGVLQQSLGKYADSRQTLLEARAQDPLQDASRYNLGSLELAMANYADADRYFREAITLKPDFALFHSARLAMLNYDPTRSQEDIVQQHVDWGASVEHRFQSDWPDTPDCSHRSEDRRLRVGYVSADFNLHSVFFFMSGVLRNHDARHFEIYCYYNNAKEDEGTKALKASVTHWRNTANLSDSDLLQLVREDGIDILVDLSGHTAGNRLEVFARRAAPIQISWLGYPQTTGLKAIDYRLTDAYFDPPGSDLGPEEIWRLPKTAICFSPPTIEVPGLVSRRNASSPIVFGALNQLQKISEPTVAAWSSILKRCPNSTLCLYLRFGDSTEVRELVLARFIAHGVDAEQIQVKPWTSTQRFIEQLADIDLALDPFPYCGGTTTNLCLWSGVPVLTLAGLTPPGRCGLSLLSVLSLHEYVAHSVPQYIDIAARLADDVSTIRQKRREIHQRYIDSALHDHAGFTRDLETAYQEMWRACRKRSGASKCRA